MFSGPEVQQVLAPRSHSILDASLAMNPEGVGGSSVFYLQI